MEHVDWKVEGMTCSNCALSVTKYLEQEGMSDVKVNPISGAVSFNNPGSPLQQLNNGIRSLGYRVVDETQSGKTSSPFLSNHKQRFFFTLPFTAVLMLHMLDGWIHLHWLMNPWVQLMICLPVFITGMYFFGRSAVKSIRSGVPNMNVLITIGAIASFAYSLTGAILQLGPDYLFFETTATIITLVFLGNYLEDISIQSTQKSIKALTRSQKVMANMIAFNDQHEEQIFEIENTALRTGDLILIKNGEQVPTDCKILWGECAVNEALITGESTPLPKTKKDNLIGGSIVEEGIVRAQVTATGSDTVLAGIIKMVEEAQAEKPPLQKMADKISAVFVPVVVTLAVITFAMNYFIFDIEAGRALMRAVAVLVISCPCAMGLATPAAIAVGMGRSARSGILFRNASSLESFKKIQQIVFDKTGTLTTGAFTVSRYESNIPEDEFKRILFSLEKFSAHPIGKSVAKAWGGVPPIQWKQVEEMKGVGIRAEDMNGDLYLAGAAKAFPETITEHGHSLYVWKNGSLLGWVDVEDEIRPEAFKMIQRLHAAGIRTIMLSGDLQSKADAVAATLGIQEVIAEKSPKEKLEIIGNLNASAPTAMVGDGINDAPALAKATLGISLSDASQIALQHADVILVNHGLKNLPEALGLGRHTDLTIKQNLFWAFFYNVIAIPIAAFGYLSPSIAALAMGFSDIVLAINSARLYVKKVF
ncbi:MAG TPA: cation-translocating P-type ATPase [Ferruginibacter sp.]|nr:cation-translocating P-type ATPase [Ferruginibacter sp.]HRO05198.1 cation-translocating P-type ATPase [Ferruginibacter sp.]HRO95497.1 cation-translocating P-type ATPase [Ferruginibacter sp.]HRP50290.1 cation-translocating P-type ATPase [Ferruginibacter sp.]